MVKKTHWLTFICLLFIAISVTGCSSAEKSKIEKTLIKDFDQLKDMNLITAESYISSEALFPNADDTIGNSQLEEFISLYFQNFDYKITGITIKKNCAVAKLRLVTIDAQSLAKDFTVSHLRQEIIAASNTDNDSPLMETSLKEHYELLNQLLRENDYEQTERNCTVQLNNSENQWVILQDEALENDIVGGFISYMANSNLLSPRETVDVYFSTMKAMNTTQLSNYLGISDFLNTGEAVTDSFSNALIAQVEKSFSYEITDSTQDGLEATVTMEITTFDYESIMNKYNTEFQQYLDTPQAVFDGSKGRSSKSNEILLKCIQDNTDTRTFEHQIHLTNDSESWIMDTSELGSVIFGNLNTTSE